ncbi:MAG: 2-C-methyl-D-erythritol 4-phosphate cytidylyltransferase [Actinomycetia bacterium]|nr:2-C-methyl-D-erythritol 4-phosphate cytidylyltransferase [Actinomycetes bacterium]MCP4961864.1 2-C-methyl-D-erythritol 4-phosphate cytidylyltransferase [Actinomycetes bacterium]
MTHQRGGCAVWTIVVAAGASTRFGRPKLLESIDGKTVVEHAVATARASCEEVVVVTSDDRIAGLCREAVVVAGGATRSASVRCGLAAVPDEVEFVLVHDAARPGADVSVFARVIEALRAGADSVVPGLAVADTIKEVSGDVVVGTPDRSVLVAVQTPQGFRADLLRRAHLDGGDATDDAALIELAGGTVKVVEGSLRAAKITTEHDLVVARAAW